MKVLSLRFASLAAVLVLGAGAVGCDDPPSAKKAPPKSKATPAASPEGEVPNPDDPPTHSKNGPDLSDPTPAIPTDPNAPDRKTSPAPVGAVPPLTPRCAIRLAVSIAGKSPDAGLLKSTDQAAAVDALLGTPDFAERFARFINSETNSAPATSAAEDPVYYLAKHVITNDKPWSDLFVGSYQVKATGDGMKVSDDANGLGYFRTDAWRRRYAGNEPNGIMLSGAFRILQNTTGLELSASVGQPDDDRTANGRMSSACKSCHFDSWFALDKVARLLPKKKGQDDAISFTPANEGPQQLFGKTIADDKALVNALVDSDAWRFQQCRTVFKFLYGRSENKCEAPAFDRCIDALVQNKTIRAAVAAVAKDPAACR
jgi:hypothetical protein